MHVRKKNILKILSNKSIIVSVVQALVGGTEYDEEAKGNPIGWEFWFNQGWPV